MKNSWQICIPKIVEAFSNIFLITAKIYYEYERPIIYGHQLTNRVCALKCLGEVHKLFETSSNNSDQGE